MSEILEFVDEKTQKAVGRIVRKAIRDGRLFRPKTCTWCGQPHRHIDAHHPDYARPLMVVWICRPCHARHHATHSFTATNFFSRRKQS